MSVARRLVHVLVIVLTLVVGATAAAIIVSQTAWFKNWLRGYIIEESAKYLNGHLTIERLGGNLFFGVELENVGISMDGTKVVAVEDLGLDYNVFQLIARGMSIDDIRLNRPTVYLKRDGDAGPRPADQEAGTGGGSRRAGVADLDRQDRGHRCLDRRRRARRHEWRGRTRPLRQDRRQLIVPL
jgi:uncharacterized protein involved in outer membrane biogenesis